MPQPGTNGAHHERNGNPHGKGPDYEPGTPGHRKQIVELAFIGTMGMTREKAEALYEKQLLQWYAQQGIQPPG